MGIPPLGPEPGAIDQTFQASMPFQEFGFFQEVSGPAIAAHQEFQVTDLGLDQPRPSKNSSPTNWVLYSARSE